MRFPYVGLPTTKPIYSLGGARKRYRPLVPITLVGPLGSLPHRGCIDSGADDTLFPLRSARYLGIDLTGAPEGEGGPAGGLSVKYRYAKVTLRLSDGIEAYEWEAIVGFIDKPLHWPLLGHAGFLDFFDVNLLGHGRETILTPNPAFPGQPIAP